MNFDFTSLLKFQGDIHTIVGALEMVGLLGAGLALFNKQFAPVYSFLIATSSKFPTKIIGSFILALKDGELTVDELRNLGKK